MPQNRVPEHTDRAAEMRAFLTKYWPAIPLGWLLLSMLPIAPFALNTGMDAAWNYAINMAHAKGFGFGSHLVFTMGPLGFLTVPDPDYTGKAAALSFRILTYLFVLYGAVRCAQLAGMGVAATVAAVLAPQIHLAQHFPDVWQAAYLAVFLAVVAGCGRTLADVAVAGCVTGLSLLVKVNEGLTALMVFLCLVAVSYLHWRRRKLEHLLLAISPLAILMAGMQAIQGNALDAFPFLRNTLDTMSGFSRSASAPGPLWQSGLTMLYLALIFAVPLLMNVRATVLNAGILPALVIAFTGFKHGMVRQDGHADMVEVKLAAAGLFLFVTWREVIQRRVIGAVCLFGAAFTVFIVAENQHWAIDLAKPRMLPSGMATSLRTMASFGPAWEANRILIHNNLAPLQLDKHFGEIIGSDAVDAFPENIDVVRANGWNYRPRPGIQSSASYTARLDRLNAEYVQSSAASKYALFVWYAIDSRHPFLQDPLTMHALLDNYGEVYRDERAILLERKPARIFGQPEAVGTSVVKWYEPMPVPAAGAGEAIVARVDIVPTMWGRLRAFLFRSTPAVVFVKYRSGEESIFRIVASNLGGGAILSPLPRNGAEFSAFLEGRAAANPVASIRWGTDGFAEYGSEIHVTWYRMRRN